MSFLIECRACREEAHKARISTAELIRRKLGVTGARRRAKGG